MWKWVVAIVVAGWWFSEKQQSPVIVDSQLELPFADGFVKSLSPDKPPRQKALRKQTQYTSGDYRITPVARFQVAGRVLSSKRYRFGRESDLAPVDLAMGWGPMADTQVLSHLTISQSGRWYHWRAQELPVPRHEIENNSANMHIIPANETVANALQSIDSGEMVRFRGLLVNIDASDGWFWRSSTTREDRGNGACELVLVSSIERI